MTGVRKAGLALRPLYPGYLTMLPGRVVIVALSAGAGVVADASNLGAQLGYGLSYFAAILISLGISYAGGLALVNLGAALLWMPSFRHGRGKGTWPRVYAWLYERITWVNRQLGHGEAFLVWLLIVITQVSRPPWQFGLIAALLFLAEPLLDAAALWLIRVDLASRGVDITTLDLRQLRREGRIHWARRPLINLATIAGAIWLALLAPEQRGTSAPFLLALGLGGLLRIIKWDRRRREVNREHGLPGDRSAFREKQVRWAALDTTVLVAFAVILAFGFVAFRERTARQAEARRRALVGLDQPPACDREAGGPVTADVQVVVLADSQLHKLDGKRFPGQLDFATTLVSVARRPVELDLLAEGTLRHFARIYDGYRQERKAAQQDLPWVYLGDLTDLACLGELERIQGVLADFGWENSAGVAPGNHDNAFTGNFAWSPHWTPACTLQRSATDQAGEPAFGAGCRSGQGFSDGALVKELSDDRLLGMFGPGVLARRGKLEVIAGRPAGKLFRRARALAGVTPLGTVAGGGGSRGVLGVFLDTTDQNDFDFGIAGMVGTISKAQAAALGRMIRQAASDAGPAYVDPYYVFFAHHQVGSLSHEARDHLDELVVGLERDGPRVIGFVSAHTHQAAKRTFCLGYRRFSELIVGSTTDPPQEMGVLTIGRDSLGVVSMALATVPAVGRTGLTCDKPGSVPAERCQKLMSRLAVEVACQELFQREDETAGAECQGLERAVSLLARVDNISRIGGPGDSRRLLDAERSRARQLFGCLCRDPERCTPPSRDAVLCDSVHAPLVERLARQPQALEEMVCLGWAASTVQLHKAAGMEVADALRCGFDNVRIQPARIMTTRLGERACF